MSNWPTDEKPNQGPGFWRRGRIDFSNGGAQAEFVEDTTSEYVVGIGQYGVFPNPTVEYRRRAGFTSGGGPEGVGQPCYAPPSDQFFERGEMPSANYVWSAASALYTYWRSFDNGQSLVHNQGRVIVPQDENRYNTSILSFYNTYPGFDRLYWVNSHIDWSLTNIPIGSVNNFSSNAGANDDHIPHRLYTEGAIAIEILRDVDSNILQRPVIAASDTPWQDTLIHRTETFTTYNDADGNPLPAVWDGDFYLYWEGPEEFCQTPYPYTTTIFGEEFHGNNYGIDSARINIEWSVELWVARPISFFEAVPTQLLPESDGPEFRSSGRTTAPPLEHAARKFRDTHR